MFYNDTEPKGMTYRKECSIMLQLGNIDADKVKRNFLRKFRKARNDASEYEFGVIKGEQMETIVYHRVCEQSFTSRPYLFIQEKWPKRCPYCYPSRKSELTEGDMRERVHEFSNGMIEMVDHEEDYIDGQKIRHVTLSCNFCGHHFKRNFHNIRGKLTCPMHPDVTD